MKLIGSRIFSIILIISLLCLLVIISESQSSRLQGSRFQGGKGSGDAAEAEALFAASQSIKINLTNPTGGQPRTLTWQEQFAAGNFAALSETAEYTIARLEKAYREKMGEWEYLTTDLNGDGGQELFLRADKRVGIFHEQEGKIDCWYFNTFDEFDMPPSNTPFIRAYPTKDNALLISYAYLPADPDVIKNMIEEYRFSADGGLELLHRLQCDWHRYTDWCTVILDGVEIGKSSDVYRDYQEEAGWLQNRYGYYEFSPAVSLILAQGQEYPQAANFEGFWHGYDRNEIPDYKGNDFSRDAYLRIEEQTTTGFQLFIFVDENFGEETWETEACLLSDDTAIFEAPSSSGDSAYGILRLTEGKISISDFFLWTRGHNINLGADCTRRVTGVYARMEQEITDYMNRYYRAFETGDIESYSAMMGGLDELQQTLPTLCIRSGMQGIENPVYHIYPFNQEGKEWYVFAEYGIKIDGLGIPLPGNASFLITRDNRKDWRATKILETHFAQYEAALNKEQQQEIAALRADTELKYQECFEQNEVILLAYLEKLALYEDQYRKHLAVEASKITVDSYVPEIDGDLWAFLDTVTVRRERHPLLATPADSGEYIKMSRPQTYEVEKGDNLYTIADKLWKNGNLYPSLMEQNSSLTENPDVILPGTLISAGQDYYLSKNAESGSNMGEYQFDHEPDWVMRPHNFGSSALYDLENNSFTTVFCQVDPKSATDGELFANWADTSLKIKEYAKQHFGDEVSNLVFEQYQLTDGELYVYSYLMTVDDEEAYLLTAAVKRTDSLQAQFIGISDLLDNFDLRGETRYIAASFTEAEEYRKSGVYIDHEIAIEPVFEWELQGLFNSFDWFHCLLN